MFRGPGQIGHLGHLVEFVGCDVGDACINRYHCVVDPDVDRAELCLDLIGRAHYSIWIGDRETRRASSDRGEGQMISANHERKSVPPNESARSPSRRPCGAAARRLADLKKARCGRRRPWSCPNPDCGRPLTRWRQPIRNIRAGALELRLINLPGASPSPWLAERVPSLREKHVDALFSVCSDAHPTTEESMAKAYWIVCYRSISDPAARDAYTKLAVPAVLASGGRFLARRFPAKTYGRYQ